ncbi:hypothetical protein DRQ53_12300, partial [bacterium]
RDGQRIAVLGPGRDQLYLFSAASLQELAKIPVGQDPVSLAEDPRSGRIFVSCRTAGRIDVVDPESARVVARFEQLDSPSELVVLRSGILAVGQQRGRSINLLDPATGALLGAVELCGSADGLVEVERLDRLFVLSNFCSEITITRPLAGLETGAIRLEERAGLPTLGPRGAEIYLPLPDSRRVALIAVDRGVERRYLDVGPTPWRVVAP